MRISDWSSDVCSSDLLTKRSEDGGAVKSHLDGSRHLLSPERSIEIQRLLGSNIVMAFDELVPTTATREVKAAAMDRTMRWAKRSRHAFDAVGDHDASNAIFGLQQGALDEGMRTASAEPPIHIVCRTEGRRGGEKRA